VEKTNSLGSRDPTASGVKCRPHGGKNSKTKSSTISWLSLKTFVGPELHGSRVMSGDWQNLLRVRGGLKDRTGDQRGGSEWELIKVLLEGDGYSNKMNTTKY
jgi:hypothetical protein